MANDTFSALTHPLRREIVERLSGGPATVGEVTRDFGVRRPDGTEVEAQGEYTVIDRPHRLVMTWTLDADLSNERLRRVRRIAITFATTRYASTASGRRSEPGCSRSTRRNAYAGQGALGAARADARAKHSAGASGGPADSGSTRCHQHIHSSRCGICSISPPRAVRPTGMSSWAI